MTDITSKIPAYLWSVEYDQNHDGRTPQVPSIDISPNCQNFAYELLRSFGFFVPPLRSSNLWEDSFYTHAVEGEPQALDLLLFNRTDKSWGAHVAVHVGNGQAIHLSKRLGKAAIWRLAQFSERPEYRVLVGAKRPCRRNDMQN